METKTIRPKVITVLLIPKHILLPSCVSFLAMYYFYEFNGYLSLNFWIWVFTMFILYVGIMTYLSRKNLENIEYLFDDEKIEFTDWFLNKQKRTVQYSKIMDIASSQTILQRFFWIWRIWVSTSWSYWYEIILDNLEYYDRVYDFLQSKIKK